MHRFRYNFRKKLDINYLNTCLGLIWIENKIELWHVAIKNPPPPTHTHLEGKLSKCVKDQNMKCQKIGKEKNCLEFIEV